MCFHHELKECPVEDGTKHKQRRADTDEREKRIQAPEGKEPEGTVSSQHEKLAMGHVQDSQHSEGQREACRRQAV